MTGSLAVTIIITSLLLAAWTLVTAARDRTVGAWHLAGLAVVEVVVLAQVAVAVARLFGGDRPDDIATFAGYLITALLLLPAAAVLARLEPTRWGAVIVGVAALILPVVVLRLQQVWQSVGA